MPVHNEENMKYHYESGFTARFNYIMSRRDGTIRYVLSEHFCNLTWMQRLMWRRQFQFENNHKHVYPMVCQHANETEYGRARDYEPYSAVRDAGNKGIHDTLNVLMLAYTLLHVVWFTLSEEDTAVSQCFGVIDWWYHIFVLDWWSLISVTTCRASCQLIPAILTMFAASSAYHESRLAVTEISDVPSSPSHLKMKGKKVDLSFLPAEVEAKIQTMTGHVDYTNSCFGEPNCADYLSSRAGSWDVYRTTYQDRSDPSNGEVARDLRPCPVPNRRPTFYSPATDGHNYFIIDGMTANGIEGRCETIHASKFGGYTFTKSRSTKSCERGIVMLVIILLIQQCMSASVSTSYFASSSLFGEASNPGPSYSIGWSSEQVCALSQSNETGGYSQSMACDQEHREISHMSQSTELKREFDQPTKPTKQKEDTDNSTYRFDPFLNAIFEGEEDHQVDNDGTGTTQDVPN